MSKNNQIKIENRCVDFNILKYYLDLSILSLFVRLIFIS